MPGLKIINIYVLVSCACGYRRLALKIIINYADIGSAAVNMNLLACFVIDDDGIHRRILGPCDRNDSSVRNIPSFTAVLKICIDRSIAVRLDIGIKDKNIGKCDLCASCLINLRVAVFGF